MSNTILVNKVLEPITARYLNGDCMLDEYGEAVKAFIVQYSQNLGQMLFSSSMNKLVTYALDLLNHHETKDIVKHKLAGLIIFDCLIDINDEIIPERRIEISNHIFKVLENDKLSLIVNEVILRTASSSIGHFARVASSSEAEFLQNFSFPLALKLLRDTKSDSHKFSGALILTQLAQNSPTLIFSKQRQVFAEICEIMSDKSPMVRSAAATALESVLRVIAQRESMSEYIKSAFKQVDSGLSAATQERIIGALCILDTILDGSVLTMGEVINAMRQYSIHPQDLIWKVLMRKDSKDLDVRRKVLEIIPNLARSFGNTFLQSNNYLTPPNNFLSYTTKFLIDQILEKKERVAAFLALTKLHSALSNHFRTALNVSDVFNAVCFGLRDAFTVEALECLGVLVSISPAFRKLVDQSLTSSMFRGGLSVQLVESLKLVTKHVPAVRNHALALVLREISGILVSNRMVSTEEQRKRQADGWVKSNKEKQKWNSGSNHRFQGTKPDAVVIDFIPSSDEIIFALRVLSESEFFPKYYREKSQGISEDDHTCTLLFLLRDSVIWYFDDPNILVRKAAATACSVVLNAIVLFVDRNSYEFLLMFHIVERLLTMGVGDDSQEIRCLVFSSFTPVLDEVLSKVGNVHCLIEGLNDEGLSVRTSAMTVLSRIARFNTLRIMPVIRLELKRLVGTLNTTQDHSVKQESVRILQALVKGSDFLIVPYVEQIIGPLLTLLNDSSPEVVAASLSTVGELALASPKSVTGHLDSLAPRVIEALNDQTSVIKQETAVIAMGKLVSSFSMVTAEPYKKYNGLFEGLVRAAQNSESLELRLQAIKTLGLLGVVDGNVYLSHLVCLNPARSAFNASSNLELFRTDFGQIEESDDEIMPEDISEYGKDQKLSQVERLYFTLIVTELMNILKESSLAYYHLSAAGVAVKTIRMLGSQSAFRVDTIVEGIFYRLMQQDAGNNIKEALLDHVITLIGALGSKMKRHNHQIVNLIKEFFDSHTQLCLDIFEALAIVYSTPDFCSVAQILFPFFAKSIEAELTFFAPTSEESSTYSETTLSANNTKVPTSIVKAGNSVGRTLNMEKISKYLQNLVNINEFLGDFRKDVYPTILMVLENPNLSVELRRDAILCIMSLVTDHDLLEIAGRVIRPLLKLLSGGDSRTQFLVMSTLCYIVCRLGTGFLPYIVLVNRKLASLSSGKDATNGKIPKCDEYDSLISRLFKQRSLPVDSLDNVSITMKVIDKVRNRIQNAKLATETGFQINIQSLETAWALADRNSSSNLVEWMNRLSNELIRQSPSSIIRSCAVLANTYRPLAEELFNIAFYCVWNELFSVQMGEVVMEAPLVSGIEMALQSPEIPKNIMISLLNLAEFMDVHDLPLPIDVRILARQAQSANMFAKCLRYREVEFQSKNLKPSLECVDALITVCNQLGLGDRAIGILRYLKFEFPDVDIQPQWLEKLCRWDEAFKAYEEQIHDLKNLHQGNYFPIKNDHCINMELGRLRCLHALGEYEDLLENAQYLRSQMKQSDDSLYWEATAEVQRLGSYAAWMLGKWESMEEFLEGEVRADDCRDVTLWNNVFFFKAVLAIHQQDYSRSLTLINDIRNSLSNGITALLSESYSRAYRAMVTMQILAEMEEVVEFKQMIDNSNAEHENLSDGDATAKFHSVKEKQLTLNSELTAKKIALIAKWRGRLKWAPKDIDVYRQILAVHTLVTEPLEDLDSWLELVTMCRKEAMQPLCANLLKKLGAPLPNKKSCAESNRDLTDLISKTNEKVLLSTYQYWWSNGEKEKALSELTSFLKSCPLPDSLSTIAHNYTSKDATMFRVRCLLKRATWMRELEKGDVAEILDTLREAQELAKDEYSVWHAWAVAHYDQLRKTGNDRKLSFDAESSSLPYIPVFISQTGNKNLVAPKHPGLSFKYSSSQKINSVQGSVSLLNLMSIQQTDQVTPYVVEAIKGFVRSIVLGQGQPLANLLQDTLRLLTLWFSYGTKKGALIILESELEKISSDNWLSVIPQLIARIHVKSAEISGLLRKILVKVASGHPQALVWPISVALNTNDGQQKIVATEILSEMKKNRRQLVEEVTMVSRELMKVAITPHELWYDGLEQAAQFYMDNKDIRSMVDTLVDLHETMNEPAWGESRKADPIVEGFTKIGSASIRDIAFRHSFGKYLQDGYFWLDQFRNSGRTVDLHQAWEIYQTMFKRIKGQISSLKRLELDHVSPALMNAKNLSLAVPGTYKPAESDTLITCFSAKVTVIASKQRPRRISMLGSDGRRYQFLLKGHEDLRQDERVMQLFGLINACLNYDRITNDRGLNVVRYSVLPLSNNSGLLEWVQSCDTMNQLIKQYREENDIKLLTEMRLLQSKSRSYDKLPLIQKVELFQQVLQETTGDDLAKILWLKSQTSDIWVERRANFTKSLAVMSMAGYILGLGDRHPSNLMIHRVSGHVVHIDFGDCFEITAHRSKYPEIIPFRLTRMLSNCMAAAGIQGSYRLTCERVMRVLRDNRDSVMAMLEAFVYDPLISWRLLGKGNDTEMKLVSHVNTVDEEFSGSQSAVDKLREQLSSGSDEKLPGLDHSIQNELSPKKSAIGSSLRDVPAVRRSKSQEGVVEDEPFQENVNARALEVINRIQSKLTGRDFLRIDEVAEDFSVEQQVDRLIKEATSIENLCQLFSGWCPLW